uniref:Centrosomal protein of 104 kDa n=1 Tax=Phallusia mammillata TaxID=59560 RepID=A0A6F9D974_9ASCI|nr:centrosomal protein of 104 kDa [Phallusia mammillata]
MPSKINYSVVGATGEADGYSAKNLEHQSPTVPGWQTARFCVYPQELIVCLEDQSRIKKLQLLAHQYMIPSKIEFFVGNNPNPDSFKRLGYIYLSNNEKTGFKSRELKSVHVDAEGRYIRLVIHKNHINKFNLYNQIGIMALNAIGDSSRKPAKKFNGNNTLPDGLSEKPDYISPMDDLAFDMYQDPEVASIIRRLDAHKKKAVIEENFDVAKRMKQAIADLQKVGEKLARYELDKRRAVENEDYDLAKSKKAQMEEYRLKVYQQLQKHDLLEDAGIIQRQPEHRSPIHQEIGTSPFRDQTPHEATPQPHVPHEDVISPRDASPQYSDVASPRAVEERDVTPIPVETQVNYDEKVIPALAKDARQDPFIEEFASPPPGASPNRPAGVPSEPEPMSERNIREAASVIDVFGLPLVSGAYSKTWSFREDALLAVYKLLTSAPDTTSKEELRTNLKAAVFLIRKAIKDKVHAVFHAALRLLELILVDFIPKHKLGKAETTHAVNRTLPNLIQKTAESAARSREAAMEFIIRMSEFNMVHQLQLVPQHTTPPFKRDMANRLALSRMELIEHQLEKFGLEPPAMSLDAVMKFATPALEHANGAVRDSATRIIFMLYKKVRLPVKSYLPKDDNRTRKNPLYRNLFDGFDRLDGKPTQSEIRSQMQARAAEEERRKKKEVEELQAQVNQLRELNKQGVPHDGRQGKKAAQRNPPPPQPEQVDPNQSVPNDDSFLDNMCIFCGERDEGFTEEGLDLHYWKQCPMLRRCEHCKQVVEISGYNEHLITECDRKNDFGKCPRCTESILNQDLQKHIADKKCTATTEGQQEHCPLCHHNIVPGEESWKAHLMGSKRDACADNSRRLPSINRLRAKAEAEKAAATKNKKKSPRK